ncbi:MAG: FIST C-terminal domain-containing protein [Acidimicrobiia bacterium]|nr:FIST C-terminal domain-containing protein [Acidimicrobiia bacterium]
MGFAAALSEHPVPTQATGEVIGQILDALGPGADPPDLALLFITAAHVGAVEDIAAAARATLNPRTLLGCTAESVVAGPREVEQRPAVALWAAHTAPVTPFHARLVPTADGNALTGWPEIDDDASAILVLADPFTFPADDVLRHETEAHPGVPVIGGLASAAVAPGGNRLVVDGQIVADGAVGAVLGPGVDVAAVVSQGCRPVGDPFVITRAEGNVVYELAGKPALERLQDVARGLDEADRQLLASGVHFGRVIDESRVTFGAGDFLIRNVIGGDPSNGALAVGDVVEVGSTAQFQVRDAASADAELQRLLEGRAAEGALLFTCNGRGSRLFGRPDHDAEIVAEHVARGAVAGMFCAGELGPVGRKNYLHGFTASVVLFGNSPT